jgi:predicted transcriptional regulator
MPRSRKLYHDPDYLKQEYVMQRKTAKEIADENGVTEMTIWNQLKKYDLLKFRGKGRKLAPRRIVRDF